MAKQLINVGSQANDGTGDSIRIGAQKLNAVIEEIYNDLGNGTDLQISIGSVTSGNVLRSNGTDFVSSQLDYNDLSGRPIIPAAQVQSDWTAESGVSSILNKPNLSTVATSGSYDDLSNKPDILIPIRTTSSASTSSISNGASENITISASKAYVLLKVQTSAAAWITLYTDTTSRTADASRLETTDPLPGSGVIAEVITSQATTQNITPGTIGWNNDSTPSENIYLKVVNKSESTASITVTLTYIQLES
jgi:hypothetical protein